MKPGFPIRAATPPITPRGALTKWVVVMALALAGGLLPTAMPAAVAAEPSPTWRGWIASELDQVPNPMLVKGRNYDRMVEVVTSPPSAPGEAQVGEWRASSYQLHVENCVGLPGTAGGELAATTGTGPNTWSFYPYQTEPTPWIAWKPRQTGDVDYAFDGVFESCDGTVKPSLGGRRHGLGLEFAAAPGDYDNPPTTVSFAADFKELPNYDGRYGLYSTARYVVCMTTSTADRDGDSLPDVVDLNPGAPGAALDLGDPAGTGQWSIPIPKYYPQAPTQAEQGLPSCPAAGGPVDTDGDTVLDAQDECPTIKGSPATAGCPDSDADGVRDSQDNCPTVPGTVAGGGCPQECVQGTGKSKTVRLNARTPVKFLPDRDWFDFKVKASWCRTEAGEYQLTDVNPKGTVDGGPGGIANKALGVFGFEPKYLSDTESVAPKPPASSATARGSFAMCFSLMKLYDKLGLKKKVRNKLEPKLEKAIAKVFRKHGVRRLEPRVITGVRHRVSNHGAALKGRVRGAVDKIDEQLRRAKVPEQVGEFLEDMVEEPFVWAVDAAETKFLDGLANRKNATPKELSEDFFDGVEDLIDSKTRWCDADRMPGGRELNTVMWQPAVTMTASPNLSYGHSDDYRHPILKVRDETE